jgi:hypothetical protein
MEDWKERRNFKELTQEQDFEPYLSHVELADDNRTILLNGESKYSVMLPTYIPIKKDDNSSKRKIIEHKIYEGCAIHKIDSVTEENIRNLANEILEQLDERRRVIRRNNKKKLGETLWGETAPPPTPTPAAPVLVELTSEEQEDVSWEDIASVLSTSIKKDKAPKLITFCAMLLAQTNEDQLNLGYQAESSSGKSYVPLELANYFPEDEVMKFAAASPTAFYHKGGTWDEQRKAIVCDLEHKIIIFLDMPHFQLLERLRPLLSHDDKELHYMITDHSQKHGLRAKNVILRGHSSFFFCTTRNDPDEQEKTRMLQLSPSTDQDKLRESLELSALRKANREEYEKRISQHPERVWLTKRILAIRQRSVREIIIPDEGKGVYDRFIKEHPYLIPRHQRDFPRIFSFIKAHALLNSFNRQKNEGKTDTIIANQTDIDAGFALYKEIELSNELGLSPYIFKIFVDVIVPLLSYDGIQKGVTREEIIKKHYEVRHKMLSPETLKREIIPQLEIAGLIAQEPDPDDKRRLLIYPTVSTPIISAKLRENEGENSKNYERDRDEHYRVTLLPPPPPSPPLPLPPSPGSEERQFSQVIQKCMLDEHGNNKGYFTASDFIYTLIMLPNEKWTEDEAEQTFYALVAEGKLVEVEPGKFNHPATDEGRGA